MSYDGPGVYRHWKGDFYEALGVGETETGGVKFVIYSSRSKHHEHERARRGVDFILRPLSPEDGPDAFNGLVRDEQGRHAHRFVMVGQG